MNQTNERRLWYYDYFQKSAKHYNGTAITFLHFKDVKTKQSVTLGFCDEAEELGQMLDEHFYEEITDMTDDFDILWNFSNETIKPLSYSFEDVKNEYQRMLHQGISASEINKAMMSLFCQKENTRKRTIQ